MKKEDEKIRISKNAFKEWLEKLQQESWQLELLISGFALFAIWEGRTLVDGFQNYHELHRGSGQITGIFSTSISWLLNIGWRIFFFNLLIHVLARGLWIGAIGLRYVSSDIDYDYFNYADIFDQFLRKQVGAFDDYIEQLERFSSVLFAYTFLLFFIFLSLVLYFIEFGLVTVFFDNVAGVGIALIMMALGLFAFIDFITMGGIKKIKEKNLAKIYFVIYRIFGFLTLSFLYRPLLYNFWDEKYTRKLFLVSIPYIILLTFLPKIETDATPYFPIHEYGGTYSAISGNEIIENRYYDDERERVDERKRGIFRKPQAINGISLPSMEVSGNYTSFFLRSYPSDANWLEENQKIIPFKKAGITFQDWYDMREDSLFNQLNIAKSNAKTPLLKEKRALSKGLRTGEIKDWQQGLLTVNGAFKIDNAYWDNKTDSVETYWEKEKDNYRLDKVKKLRNGILELAKISIDGVIINEDCDCKFYMHPNIGEKGLRCYFSIDKLADGPHLMQVDRTYFTIRRNNTKERVVKYFIPFYKIKKEF